jgi:hypothetical protein
MQNTNNRYTHHEYIQHTHIPLFPAQSPHYHSSRFYITPSKQLRRQVS